MEYEMNEMKQKKTVTEPGARTYACAVVVCLQMMQCATKESKKFFWVKIGAQHAK